MQIKPIGIDNEYIVPKVLRLFVYLLLAPKDWKAELNPWSRWSDKNTNPKQYKITRQSGMNLCCNSSK